MRIAYISLQSAETRISWSGLVYYIREALKSAGAEVETIAPLDSRHAFGWKVLSTVLLRITGKRLLWERIPSVAKRFARQVDRRLVASKADWIVSPSSLLIPHISDPRPKAFWTDATFDGMVDFYFPKRSVFPVSLRHGSSGEKAAINAANFAVYSSDWAARSAIDHYHASPDRIALVPFGANFDVPPRLADVEAGIGRRTRGSINLLFIGADWERKRAQFAIEVADYLVRSGREAVLHLVGCTPPVDARIPIYVRVHGFVSKDNEAGRQQLERLYGEAHFFILPSRAEACAVVLAEAVAYGVPVLGSDVGGMATIIREGISGRAFPLAAGSQAYADYIIQTMDDWQGYQNLARAARSLYDRELNWGSAGRRFCELIREA